MSYRVLVQPTAFQEIEASYRWMCDNLSAEAANQWYYELQDAITFKNFLIAVQQHQKHQ